MSNTSYKLVLAAVLSLAIIGTVIAQKNSGWTPLAKKNLVAGIMSDNEGLKSSSIYLAGKYKIQETVPALMKVFKTEKNNSIKILAAFSLYKIGDVKSLTEMRKIVQNENDPKTRSTCNTIIEQFDAENLMIYE